MELTDDSVWCSRRAGRLVVARVDSCRVQAITGITDVGILALGRVIASYVVETPADFSPITSLGTERIKRAGL